MSDRFKALPLAGAVLTFALLCACGGGGTSSSVPVTPARPLAAATPDSSAPAASVVSRAATASTSASTTASTGTPNYLGYVSWFWGDQNRWTINCDAPVYFSPHTCLVVNVQSGGTHVDGPSLAVGEFVAIYADPNTSGASGLNVVWYRTSYTPFPGSPLPNGYSGAAPSTPAPAPTVPASPGALPWIYSQSFSSNSPFHKTVAQHKAAGAWVLGQSAMNTLWNQGVSYQDLSTNTYMFPVYVSSTSDPVKTIWCSGYGACNANGMQIHVPNGAQQEPHADGHIAIIDPSQNIEFDGYQCWNGSALSCTWGGKYALGGNGVTNSASEGVHAGYAAGVMAITAQELLNGHIDHALGMNTSCLNNPTVYPADTLAGGTDTSCGWSGSPSYGNLVHLTLTPSQIAATNHSTECKAVLTALSTYGAYTYDTGNQGISLVAQSTLSYTSIGKSSPWASTIVPHFIAAGESSGNYWGSCLNGLSAANFELIQIAAGSY